MVLCAADSRHDAGQLIDRCLNGGCIWGLGLDSMAGAREESNRSVLRWAMARRIAMKNGIRYAYTGNVHDSEGASISCHQCGQTLIRRDWYELSEWNLTAEGTCRFCGAGCAGVFDAQPGRWGARRRALLLKGTH